MDDRPGVNAELVPQLIRPTRLAVLVGDADGWELAARAVLEIFTGSWGGAGNLIVPFDTDTGEVDEAIWELVSRFDPDVWGQYHHTGRSIEIDDPTTFEEGVRARSGEHADSDSWMSIVRDDLRRSDLNEFDAPEGLIRQLLGRTSPTWDDDFGRLGYLATDTHPAESLVVDVGRLTELPDRIVSPTLEGFSPSLRLLIASRFGSLNPRLVEVLKKREVALIECPVEDSELRNARQLGWGHVDGRHWSLGATLAEFGTDYSDACPFALANVGLARFTRSQVGYYNLPIVIVVGDTFNDFAYALAADREFGDGLWAPSDLVLTGAVVDATAVADLVMAIHHARRRDRQRPILIVSRSRSVQDLEVFAASIREWIHDEVTIPSDGRLPLPRYRAQTVLDQQGVCYPSGTVFLDSDGTMLTRVSPGLPTARTLNPIDMLWWSDVLRDHHRLPPRRGLNDHVSTETGFNTPKVRIGHDGLTFASQCRDFMSGSATLEQVLARPNLRYPDATTVFHVLAEKGGATLRESDKGSYARLTVERWGDRNSLILDLQDGATRRLLEAWQSKSDSGETPGNFLTSRRFLSIEDMTDVLDSDRDDTEQRVADLATIRPIVDRYLKRGILRRGLCLACASCRHMGWYDAEDVGQDFRCQRCRAIASIDSTVTRGKATDAVWYYALHEVVYQAFEHNSVTPLLATGSLAAGSRSALWMSEHEVRLQDGTDKFEADLWMIVDGQIIVGEAKVNGSLGASRAERSKEAMKYRRLADLMTADRVVFAASRDWDPESRSAIDASFSGHRIVPEFLVVGA